MVQKAYVQNVLPVRLILCWSTGHERVGVCSTQDAVVAFRCTDAHDSKAPAHAMYVPARAVSPLQPVQLPCSEASQQQRTRQPTWHLARGMPEPHTTSVSPKL